MEKLIRLTSFLMITVLIVSLAACSVGGLSGTYKSTGLISQSFTFDGNNITMSAFGINANGTYKLSDGNIIITYSLLGQEYTWSQSFSKLGDTLLIGGTEFKKQ